MCLRATEGPRYKFGHRPARPARDTIVQSLFRLLLVLGILAAIAWGVMLAMVTYLEPRPHAIEQSLKLPDAGTSRR